MTDDPGRHQLAARHARLVRHALPIRKIPEYVQQSKVLHSVLRDTSNGLSARQWWRQLDAQLPQTVCTEKRSPEWCPIQQCPQFLRRVTSYLVIKRAVPCLKGLSTLACAVFLRSALVHQTCLPQRRCTPDTSANRPDTSANSLCMALARLY